MYVKWNGTIFLQDGFDPIHVPPLDPLSLKDLNVKIDQKGSPNILIDGTAKVQIIGMRRINIKNVR